jgi:hypothetical protein
VPPTLGQALRLGVGGLARAPWLFAAGLLVALAGSALLWPAWAAGWAILVRAAVLAAQASPLDPLAALAGVAAAASSPRFVALVLALLLAGVALGWTLRVAFVAGAVPALAGASAGDGGTPRFAAGLAYGFPRVLAASVLGLLLRAGAWGFAIAIGIAALRISGAAAGEGGSPWLAAAVAAALTLAVLVPLALGAVADVAIARAALLGDGPGEALAAAADRFAARPGTFVLAALAFAAAGAAGALSIQAMGSLATGFAGGLHPLVAAGPSLMIAAAGALVAAAIDLAWLGTAAALGCAGEDAVAT